MRKLLCILLTSIVFSCASSGPQPGDAAPSFNLQTIDGQAVSLAQHKGKLVLVHFWADWCESCRKEFPIMQAYYQKLGGDKFELLAINVGQSASISASFKNEFQATFPMIADEQGQLASSYGIEKYPTNYLINPEGKIIRKVVGWVDEEFISNVLYNIEQQRR